MQIKKVNILSLVPGDVFYRGSLCEILEVSAPRLMGYGHDEHYYQAESVIVKCQAFFDYDVAYAQENNIPLTPRVYSFDYPIESDLFKVLTGDTITVTKFSGEWSDTLGRYVLPGQTITVIE